VQLKQSKFSSENYWVPTWIELTNSYDAGGRLASFHLEGDVVVTSDLLDELLETMGMEPVHDMQFA